MTALFVLIHASLIFSSLPLSTLPLAPTLDPPHRAIPTPNKQPLTDVPPADKLQQTISEVLSPPRSIITDVREHITQLRVSARLQEHPTALEYATGE